MNLNLAKYAGMKICVAVSGGRDSMALLHYLNAHGKEYGITLSALNCDHKIRGEASAKDSAFVKEWCRKNGVRLLTFEWDFAGEKTETLARVWRLKCYQNAAITQTLEDGTVWEGVDAVASAHHLNDNAETVLFNLARGSSLSGLTGITDGKFPVEGGGWVKLIHPLIDCTRSEIEAYIGVNGVPYVDDETNFTDNYTRNKLRHNVLPELEKVVPNAAGAIYRFSRLAAEDEEFFEELITKRNLIKRTPLGAEIAFCEERAVFKRAAIMALKLWRSGVKDYTAEHAQKLYDLQFAEVGKRFEFLDFIAFKEDGKIAICDKFILKEQIEGRKFFTHFGENSSLYFGQFIKVCEEGEFNEAALEGVPEKYKLLKFDFEKIPQDAVIRFMQTGDRFEKFGGGTKNLGDFFTDKKIPVRIRRQIPIVASGSEVLAIGGLEISEKVKVTDGTKAVGYLICADYARLK